ncbi:hypothetical protein B0H13DRAFT_2316770 [Mycena leptocephala]|nr:hypothetical protein B0H13DRAFT_2316770 [Mycena leptocephala]
MRCAVAACLCIVKVRSRTRAPAPKRRRVIAECSYHLLAHRTTYAYAVARAHPSTGVLDRTPNSPPWVPFRTLHTGLSRTSSVRQICLRTGNTLLLGSNKAAAQEKKRC